MLKTFRVSLFLLLATVFATCSVDVEVNEKSTTSVNKTQQDSADAAFIFFGDFGTGTADQMRIAGVMTRFCATHRCDFLLTLGDNIYDSGVMSVDDVAWQERVEVPYGPMKLPMYATLGNHDYRGSPQAQVDYTAHSSMWRLPSHYYAFDAGNVHLMGIDTNAFNEPQQTWLTNELSASTSTWKIVFGHHPVESYGRHGPKEEVAPFLQPILKQGADLYLAGHDHDKQVIQKGSPHPLYVVSGAAAKVRPTQMGDGTLFAVSTLGFGYLVVHGDSMQISFIDERGNVEYTTVIYKRQ